MARLLIVVFFLVWAALVARGFIVYFETAPTGDGFVRGLNRAGLFFAWQGAALLAAAVGWIAGLRSKARGLMGWLGRIPIILSGGAFVILIAILVVIVANERLAG
jgi:hypothetical protein